MHHRAGLLFERHAFDEVVGPGLGCQPAVFVGIELAVVVEVAKRAGLRGVVRASAGTGGDGRVIRRARRGAHAAQAKRDRRTAPTTIARSQPNLLMTASPTPMSTSGPLAGIAFEYESCLNAAADAIVFSAPARAPDPARSCD